MLHDEQAGLPRGVLRSKRPIESGSGSGLEKSCPGGRVSSSKGVRNELQTLAQVVGTPAP